MPRKTKVSSEVLKTAMEAAEKAKTPDDLRAAQAVLLPGLLGISDRMTAKIIGRSRVTVVQLRKKFSTFKELHQRNWGGRRSGYMTTEQERQFLSEFLDQAAHDGILVVSRIKQAFEDKVGHKVAESTIYRMLDRHDWRTIVPRLRHPNSNAEAREGLKKLPKTAAKCAEALAPVGVRLRLMLQDEGRFGRISRPQRCRAPRGIRPYVAHRIVREHIYACAAVSPHDDTPDSFSEEGIKNPPPGIRAGE